ncbi:hypothetical protein IAU60_003037 [Kwoniella sp. DSM 27419]
MRTAILSTVAVSTLLSAAYASIIDVSLASAKDLITDLNSLVHPTLKYAPDYFDPQTKSKRPHCTLKALGDGKDDSNNLLAAPVDIYLSDAVLDLHGWLTFSDDVDYWVNNHFDFPFQKQSLALIIRGHDYILNGNDIGGIDGNGQVWYDWSKSEGNKYGRPMSLTIKDSKNVMIKNFSIIQPQFWASLVWGSENVHFKDFYVNATSFNPASQEDEKNWLQNTENFVYQGGDDCIALKPNSTLITVKNVTCVGGTGIAFGSIAQYDGVKDIIEDVYMENIGLYPSNQCPGYQGVYFKSYSIGHPPNGGGGGYGYAKNITVKDVYMKDIWHPIVVQSEWSDIHLHNFTGNALYNRVAWMSCSKLTPCHDWTFSGIDIQPGKRDHPEISFTCNNFVLGGSDGLSQCHPSNSTLETDAGGTL